MNPITNITRGLTVTVLTAAMALGGCANMSETQTDSAKGAGIGALAGVLLGAATGGSKGAAQGAVIGAGAGALGGYIWSTKMQEQKRAMEAATAGTGQGRGVAHDQYYRISAEEHLANVSILVHGLSPLPSLTPLGKFRPHFLDIL